MVKRSTININFIYMPEYAFINHFLPADTYGPVGTSYATGELWTKNLDANGWPNETAAYDNRAFGCGIRIPSSSDYTGKYVLDWQGNGEANLAAGTWTIDPVLSSNYTAVSSTRWHGTNSRIVLSYTGPQTIFGLQILRTNRDGSGNLIKNVRFYRLEDEADLIAGKVFRRGWLQTLADLNPSAIRFMNWMGQNTCRHTLFEYRLKPGYANYSTASNWTASPPYPVSTGTNQISVGSAAGMPATLTPKHGEIVTCRIGNSTVRNGVILPSNITNANPAVVTYDATFNPANGDVLVFSMEAGMTQLHQRPVTVANLNTTNKTFECQGLDTTGFTPFARDATQTGNITLGSRTVTGLASTAGISVGMRCFASGIPLGATVESKTANSVTFSDSLSGYATVTANNVALIFGTGSISQYITLESGGRGAYPVLFDDGSTQASRFGDGYIAAGDYKTFIFDKELISSTAVNGAWTFNNAGDVKGHEGNPPIEICVALINELMAMTRSDGGVVGPIDMWATMPHRGLQSVDPDYSAASNFAVKAVDVILNGANGYPGLNALCSLLIEFSNETWNFGGSGFSQTYFLARKGFLRYGGGTSDASSYSTLRAVLMVNDLKTAFPPASNPRIKYVMAGQGTLGITGTNDVRINGNANYDGDVLNVWGGDPIDHFHIFAWAAYILAGKAFDDANMATLVASWEGASTPKAKEDVCAQYVVGLVGSGSGETTSRYGGILLPLYAAEMVSRGKETGMYEGGWDRDVTLPTQTVTTTNASANITLSGSAILAVGSYVVGKGVPDYTTVLSSSSGAATLSKNATRSGTETMSVLTPTNMFLRETKRSWAWAKALKNLFNQFDAVTGANYPADYIEFDGRWGHAFPNLYKDGIEGGMLDQAWIIAGIRNRSKRRLKLSTGGLPVASLAWATLSPDSTPDFNITIPPGVLNTGDTWVIEIDTTRSFSAPLSVSGSVNSTDAADGGITATFSTPLVDGAWFARCRILRASVPITTWSNYVSFTINAIPVMTSPSSISMAEANYFVFGLTASQPSTFTIGGTDAARFQIAANNQLRFVSLPSFGSPADAGSNNVYDITITPTAIADGDVGSAQSVAVTITAASDASATTSFMARSVTSGGTVSSRLDATHVQAVKEFINGLNSDGIWGNFDAIHLLATQAIGSDSMDIMRMNLVQNLYNLTGSGGTFTVDQGWPTTSNTMDTGFNPSTAVSAKYALNDAHIMTWNDTNTGNRNEIGTGAGAYSGVGMNTTGMNVGINQSSAAVLTATLPGVGFLLAQRTASSGAGAVVAYTGLLASPSVSVANSVSNASTSLSSGNFQVGAVANINYATKRISAVSYGRSMSVADVNKFYNRLQNYMIAIGNT